MELQTGVLNALRAAPFPGVVRECEQALVNLALEAAQRLVSGLPVSPEMIEAVVKEACAQAEDSAELHIQLAPGRSSPAPEDQLTAVPAARGSRTASFPQLARTSPAAAASCKRALASSTPGAKPSSNSSRTRFSMHDRFPSQRQPRQPPRASAPEAFARRA